MSYRFIRPPESLRRARHDNLALVPGDLLPLKDAWQYVANSLPVGAVLIVLPKHNRQQKQALLAVAKLLAQEGHEVSVRPADSFTKPHVQ